MITHSLKHFAFYQGIVVEKLVTIVHHGLCIERKERKEGREEGRERGKAKREEKKRKKGRGKLSQTLLYRKTHVNQTTIVAHAGGSTILSPHV